MQYGHRASYYDDWVEAYSGMDLFDCQILNLMTIKPEDLSTRIEEYDLVILLHSATGDTLDYLTPLQSVLAGRKRPKLLAFVGNEFNSPYTPLEKKIAALKACRADVIATQLLEEAGRYIYQSTGAKIVSLPHALNPAAFDTGKPYDKRGIDVGMRSFRYPPYLGDNDRNRIIDYFIEHGPGLGLVQDISTIKRFTPDKWGKFLGNCKTVLSTETGSWYLQPDDSLVTTVYSHIRKNRSGMVMSEDNRLRRLVRYLPAAIKSPLMYLIKNGPLKYDVFEDEKLDFDEIYEHFFKTAEKCPVYSKAISSRHFEAMGTRACQIMFPGRYNDIMVADEHYLALDPDFSNISDVVDKLRDEAIWTGIVDQAYQLVMDQHTYAHRAKQTYDIVQSL